MEYTIDELARVADTTVRSVRVYHERGLLPSPEVRGRIGYYRADHLDRLQMISRLLSRGMKLNGIRELLEAWDRGDELADVLGVAGQTEGPQPPAQAPGKHPASGASPSADESPERPDDVPVDDIPPEIDRLANPHCWHLATRLAEAGLTRTAAARLVDRLRHDCDRIADEYGTAILYSLTGGTDEQQADRSPDDQARLEADLAFANLLTTRATTELIDQALTRYTADSPWSTEDPAGS